MNAAFVEYGMLAESAVASETVSSPIARGIFLPQVEVPANQPDINVYAWVEGRVHAAPHQILAHLRDYLSSSAQAQPKGYFKDIEVEEGGIGAGTIYHATIALHGIIINRLVAVSEPERNVIVETDLYTSIRTSFTMRESFGATYLRISTELPVETSIAPVSTPLPSEALIRRINLAELVMTQRYFA